MRFALPSKTVTINDTFIFQRIQTNELASIEVLVIGKWWILVIYRCNCLKWLMERAILNHIQNEIFVLRLRWTCSRFNVFILLFFLVSFGSRSVANKSFNSKQSIDDIAPKSMVSKFLMFTINHFHSVFLLFFHFFYSLPPSRSLLAILIMLVCDWKKSNVISKILSKKRYVLLAESLPNCGCLCVLAKGCIR